MRDATTLPHDIQNVGRPWDGVHGNCDVTRKPIDTIVLHSMAGTMQGTVSHFKTADVAAHYGIGLDGRIVQFLPETVTGYHAGVYEVNQRSIGIEGEDNANNMMVRPDAFYESYAQLVADIAKEYSIPLDVEHVKLHREIKATSCPGNLDRDRILRRAKEILNPSEALHTYELSPAVFVGMVTKSSEYDELWKYLGLPDDQKANSGSHMLIVNALQKKLDEAKSSAQQNTTVIPASSLPQKTSGDLSPSSQAKSIWRADIKDLLSNILSAVRGRNGV